MISSSSSPPFGRVVTVIDRISDLGGTLGAFSLLGILALLGSEIVLRNFVGISLHFSWDLAGYLMGSCFLLTAAAALKSGSHVRVTALLEVSSPPLARVLERCACLVGLVICVMFTWALGEMAWLSGVRGSTAATAFRVPLVYPQSVLAFGAALFTLQCFAQFLRLLRGEELPTGQGLD